MAEAERREQITAGIIERTGITEAMIEQLVHGFYAKVRSDPMLAPVFEARITDWEPHLTQMCAFWSSVALMTGRYHGTPMVKHYAETARSMPRISTAGSTLFEATAHELCPPVAAVHFIERAPAHRREPREWAPPADRA